MYDYSFRQIIINIKKQSAPSAFPTCSNNFIIERTRSSTQILTNPLFDFEKIFKT